MCGANEHVPDYKVSLHIKTVLFSAQSRPWVISQHYEELWWNKPAPVSIFFLSRLTETIMLKRLLPADRLYLPKDSQAAAYPPHSLRILSQLQLLGPQFSSLAFCLYFPFLASFPTPEHIQTQNATEDPNHVSIHYISMHRVVPEISSHSIKNKETCCG